MSRFKYYPSKHLYTYDDVKILGVTEVLSCLVDYADVPKEVLDKARLHGIVTHAAIRDYLINNIVCEDLPDGFEEFWPRVYDSYIHDKNVILDFKTRESKPYYDALQLSAYSTLVTDAGPGIHIETPMYSASHNFGGTPDYVSFSNPDLPLDLYTMIIKNGFLKIYKHDNHFDMFKKLLIARQSVALWKANLKPCRSILKLNTLEEVVI